MKTLSLTIMFVSLFSISLAMKGAASVTSTDEIKVIRMNDNDEFFTNWRVTNDSVMGGRSSGNITVNNNIVQFFGTLSIENNGGFTSAFNDSFKLPEEIETVTILVKGDGKNYQLRMRSMVSGYIIAYKIEFATKPHSLVKHTFKLADFQASFRGRNITNAPRLEPDSIREVGILFTSKITQKFSLSIHELYFQ